MVGVFFLVYRCLPHDMMFHTLRLCRGDFTPDTEDFAKAPGGEEFTIYEPSRIGILPLAIFDQRKVTMVCVCVCETYVVPDATQNLH